MESENLTSIFVATKAVQHARKATMPEAQKKKTNAKGRLLMTFDTCGKDAHDHEHKYLKCNKRNFKGYSGRVGVFCLLCYTSLGKIQSYFYKV